MAKMVSIMLCFLLLSVTAGQSHAEIVPEFVTMSDLKQLIAETTAPLLARIETLETKVMALEADNTELKSKLRNQESELNQYRTSVHEMEKVTASRNQRCLSLARRLKFLEKAMNYGIPDKASKQLASPLTKESPDRTQDLPLSSVKTPSITKRAGNDRREAFETTVAFQVAMHTTQMSYTLNQDVVFDNVITNVGNAFRATHGLFIAPVPGIYVFSMTIMSAPGHNTHAAIAVNGKLMVFAYAKSSPDVDQVSNSLVVQLSKGDDVAVRTTGPSVNSAAIYGTQFSTFSGFLLREDTQSVSPIG